jgi:hypothetical protein
MLLSLVRAGVDAVIGSARMKSAICRSTGARARAGTDKAASMSTWPRLS